MNKLFRILIIYFIILNLLFGNSQIKEVRAFETLKNPRIFEQLLSEDYSKWEKEKNNVSPNLVSEKRGKRVLGSAYSLRSDLTGGMLDSNGNINVFKDGNLTATAGVSRQKGESEAVYYSNNEDITKGKTTYNNNPEVKVTGVDVKTKEIEGSVKSLDIISVQDSVNGKSRRYSVNVGIGFGKHTNGEKVVNGPYISSVGAGYSKSDTTQKITRNVAEFSAESGILEVKDKVRQVGSLIDGGFTLNAKKYEHEDLEDINKSKSIGINVTVYPNVTYTVRDGKGKGIYTDGHTINGSGAVYKVGVSYAEVDKNREVVSTIGSNVKISQDMGDINRDVNNQVKEFEGKEVRGINVDLGTEYWLTEAGRGKTRDIIEGAGRTVKSIKKILTKTDSNGELEIVKNMEAESALRKMEQRGFVEGKDKKIERVAKEIETKYGNLTKKGIRVRFYGEEDVDTSGLTEAQLRKLKADGIATTGDGYIWINKEKIKDGNTINFNKVVSHEITHQILGEDSEYEARYVESGMEEFLSEIKGNGYLKDGKIIDLLYSRLTDEDRARLNRYVLEDMQFKDLSGGAGDRYTVVNLKYQKIGTALNQAGKNDRISRMYERAKERNKGDKNSISKSERRIKELKDKGNLTKKETAELIKLTGEIYKEEKEITKLTERYESLEEITEDKKEYLTYIAGLKDKRKELEKYEIKILYKDENGNIYVKQTSGNPEEKARQEYYMREMQKNSREGIDQNVIDKALSPISKIEEMISNGEIVEYKGGGIITGYGITENDAKNNYEIRTAVFKEGAIQSGTSGYRVIKGIGYIGASGGCTLVSLGGCSILGAAMGTMGYAETVFGGSDLVEGLNKIDIAATNRRDIGYNAIEEYRKTVNNSAVSGEERSYYIAKAANPIADSLKMMKLPDWVYAAGNGASFVASMGLEPYRIAITSPAAKYITKYNSPTFVTPERYYNVKAENGLLSYESQQAVVRNYGDIINRNYLINDPLYVYQKNSEDPKFDFRHIIDGETNKSGTRSSGGHSGSSKNVNILEVYGKPDGKGVTKTKVEIYNSELNKWVEKKTQNTTFPKEWNAQKIEWEVNGAWNSQTFRIDDRYWDGMSPSGVKIGGFVNPNKTLAYPIYKEGELK